MDSNHNRFAFRDRNVTALLTFSKHEDVVDSATAQGDVFQNLWMGCTIAACSNVVIAAGLNVQKYTHMHLSAQQQCTSQIQTPVGNSASQCAANQTNASSVSLKYYRFPLWWLGIALLVMGEMGNFVAYGIAPASAIAPLGITCVIANVGIARIFLKETLRWTTLVGSFIGVTGAVLLVLFIAKENDTIFDPRGVEMAVTQPFFVLYLTGLAVALVVLFLLYYIQRTKSLLVILFIANILAAITVITAKAVSGFAVLFLRGSLSVVGLLGQPVLYFLISCVVVTGVTQVKYVQDALALYPATFVVPVNYILFTLSAITAGILFYGELLGLGEINIIIFIIGCILCFAGVFLITDDGRACAAVSQQNDESGSAIGETSLYGGTISSCPTAVEAGVTQNATNAPSQNRVITMLRDCVKITQSKFELQPLLHSSPAQQANPENPQIDKSDDRSQAQGNPSPISKHHLTMLMKSTSMVQNGSLKAPPAFQKAVSCIDPIPNEAPSYERREMSLIAVDAPTNFGSVSDGTSPSTMTTTSRPVSTCMTDIEFTSAPDSSILPDQIE